MKILIVDDERPICEWLEFTLRSLPFECEIVGTAYDGKAAIELFNIHKPDVVFTDIRMPVLDGIGFLRGIIGEVKRSYIVIISNYDDFEFAREAFMLGASEFILKTELDSGYLTKLLKKAEAALQSHKIISFEQRYNALELDMFINSALQADSISEDEVRRMFLKRGVTINESAYFAMAVQLSQPAMFGQMPEIPQSEHIENICVFHPKNEHIIILANLSCNSVLLQMTAVYTFAGKMQELFGTAVGVSAVYNGFRHLPHALNQSVDALDMNFYEQGNIHILGYNQIQHNDLLCIKQHGQKLMESIAKQNQEDAISTISEIFEVLRVNMPISKKSILHFFHTVLYAVVSRRFKNDFARILLENDLISKSISETSDLNELEQLVCRQVKALVVNHQRENHFSYHVSKSIRYMQENFSSPITLQDISDHTGLTAEYFCRLFKSETGMTFSHYLTQLRIDHAKSLLESTGHRISQVASACGYTNISYFSRIFKEHTGFKPNEYRFDNRKAR